MLVLSALILIATATIAVEGGRTGIYIAPILTSGHFGVVGDNIPAYYYVSPLGNSAELSPYQSESVRRLSFGAKLGLFFKPGTDDGKHRFDIEAQWDLFTNDFRYSRVTADSLGTISDYSVDEIRLRGNGINAKLKWGYYLDERWEPFVSLGYGVGLLNLGDASGITHGPNIGSGMRITLCHRFSFIFEYETSPMTEVEFDLADVDAGIYNALDANARLKIQPGYSQISAGFEFPISFCVDCDPEKSPCRDRRYR